MRRLFFVCMVLMSGSAAFGQGINPLSPSLYYEIGGGSAFNRPLSENTEFSTYGIDTNLELPLNCGIWDARHLQPDVWLGSIQDYAEGQLNELGKQVVTQIQTFAQGLAVAALQRALPGMYAYSQSLTASIEGKIDVAKRSCEAVVADINNGVNPLDPWRRIGTAFNWRSSLTDAGFNPIGNSNSVLPSTIIEAEAQISQSSYAPIPWFGGLKGSAQLPIVVTADLIRAGFNIHSGTVPGDPNIDLAQVGVTAPQGVDRGSVLQRGVDPNTVDSRLFEIFHGGSDTAITWGQRFLGEQIIYTCDVALDPNCASDFQPGLGLAAMITDEVKVLRTEWVGLLNGGTNNPESSDMLKVSSPSVMISPDVFTALSRFPVQDQDLYVGRLIDDVALSRTVERALAIRKMLKSSSDTPMVQGYVPASEVADELIEKITVEVDDLLWTIDAQKKLASNTSSALLEYDALRKSQGAGFIATGRRMNVVNTVTDRPVVGNEILVNPN